MQKGGKKRNVATSPPTVEISNEKLLLHSSPSPAVIRVKSINLRTVEIDFRRFSRFHLPGDATPVVREIDFSLDLCEPLVQCASLSDSIFVYTGVKYSDGYSRRFLGNCVGNDA